MILERFWGKNKDEEMTKLPNKILIVDEQMENDIRQLPDYHDMAKDFELVNVKDSKAFKDFKVFKDKELIPLKDYQKGHLIKSELHLNRYYPLFDYAENFYEDLAAILYELSSYMGAKNFVFAYTEEEMNKKEQCYEREAKLGGQNKLIDAELKGKSQELNNETNSNAKGLAINIAHKGIKLSPKELDEHINKEGINLNALPPTFQALIKSYKQGVSLKSYQRGKFESKSVEECQSTCKEFSASGGIVGIFKLEFGLKIDEESKSYEEMKKQLFFKIDFAE